MSRSLAPRSWPGSSLRLRPPHSSSMAAQLPLKGDRHEDRAAGDEEDEEEEEEEAGVEEGEVKVNEGL